MQRVRGAHPARLERPAAPPAVRVLPVGDPQEPLGGLISRTFTLDQINEAMDEVRAGSALRNVIVFDDA